MIKTVLLTCCLTLTLAACTHNSASLKPSAPPNSNTFTSQRYGITLRYPAKLELRHSFKTSYLSNGHWETYSGPDGAPGKPLAALVMPNSNEVTDGELRIGVSRNPQAVANCTRLPAAARPDSLSIITLDGVMFTTYKAADAAMSHYLSVKSFRAVHQATCYAIDVLVFGTNPKVYAPPRAPPFSKKTVFQTLIPVVHNLRFIDNPAVFKLPATYTGLLPCADCPGIHYQLNLLADHEYQLKLIYKDRDTQFVTSGRWFAFKGKTGERLLLRENKKGKAKAKPKPRQWQVSANGKTLTLLNTSGHPIQSQLNFSIHKQTAFKLLQRSGSKQNK